VAFEAKTGVLTVPTGAIGTTLAVNCGLAAKPKAILLVMIAGRTSATDAVGLANWSASLGIGTSDTNRFSVGTSCTNGAAASDGTKRRTNAQILTVVSGAAVVGALDLDAVASWPADGFQLIVDTQFTTAYKVQWFAWTGDEITNATCIQIEEPVTAADTSYTGLGFTPSDGNGIVILISDVDTTAPANTQTTRASKLMLGAATSVAQQACISVVDDQGSATIDTDSWCGTGRIAVGMPDVAGTAVDGRGAFNGWISDGFKINWAEVPGTLTRYYFALVIKGGKWAVGDFATRTDTTNITTESTGLGFTPVMIGPVVSACRAVSTDDVPTVHLEVSVGGADSASNRHAQGVLLEDGTANTEIQTAIEYDALYVNMSASAAIEGLGDIVSFGADGFTVVMDDADPVASFVWYVASGAAAAVTTSFPYRKRMHHALLTH
jgi:hypothetical protein